MAKAEAELDARVANAKARGLDAAVEAQREVIRLEYELATARECIANLEGEQERAEIAEAALAGCKIALEQAWASIRERDTMIAEAAG